MEALKLEYYTYADYLTWDDDVRCELINGVVYKLETPSLFHQMILGEIFLQIYKFAKGTANKVFYAPLDVRLNPHTRDDTVVQPDILVVCDKEKVDKYGIIGAPDLTIEVLSPSSIQHDVIRKQRIYREAGVREYWIVNPESKELDILLFETNEIKYHTQAETAPVHILPGCEINLAEVFAAAEV